LFVINEMNKLEENDFIKERFFKDKEIVHNGVVGTEKVDSVKYIQFN